MCAAKYNQAAIVAFLLEVGADPEILTADGKTAADLTSDPEISSLFDYPSQIPQPVHPTSYYKAIPKTTKAPFIEQASLLFFVCVCFSFLFLLVPDPLALSLSF